MVGFALPIRVLGMAPRLSGQHSSGARRRSEALYDALEAQGELASLEWLRPATLEALHRYLQSEHEQPVRVLYLDAPLCLTEHGLAISWEASDGARQDAPWSALQEVLADRAPLLILANVSPSARTALAQAIAVAQRDAIVLPQKLGAEAASAALMALFTALFSGQSLASAMAALRNGGAPSSLDRWLGGAAQDAPAIGQDAWLLARDPEAPWLSPPIPQIAGVGKVVRFPSQDLLPPWRRLAVEPNPGALPPEPEHGFVGREGELAALDRLLSDNHEEPIVWVCGHEGLGKTSLVAHEARWLARTGHLVRVAYTSFASGALPETALYDLGVTLLGDEFSLAQPDALAAIEAALENTPSLIIWDDVETILPGGEHPLPTAQLAGLRELAERLTDGAANLCLIANSPCLPEGASGLAETGQTLIIEALPLQEAIALLGVAARHLHHALPAFAGAQELVDKLGGHPLALCALAPLLAERSAEQLVGQLRQALPALDLGEARLRNQALYLALDQALQQASPEAQAQWANMGLFDVGFMEMLGRPVVGLDESSWAKSIGQLKASQLARLSPLPALTVPYVRLHSALPRHLRRRLTTSLRIQAEQRLAVEYRRLLAWLPQLSSRSAKIADTLFRCEAPNMVRVLDILLSAQELEAALSHARQMLPFLQRLGWRDTWNLSNARIERATQIIVPAEGPLGRPGVRFLLSQSEHLAAAGRMQESGALLQQLTQRMSKEGGLSYEGSEANLDRGIVMHRLARFMSAAGRPDIAIGMLAMAEQSLQSVDVSEARQALIQVYGDRGGLLLAAGQPEKAEEAAQAALQIATALHEPAAIGAITAQLGSISLARGDAPHARQRLLAAIDLLSQNPEDPSVAGLWQQLGELAWETSQDASEAERCLGQASAWAARVGQASLQGQAELRLAEIEEATGRLEMAEARLLRIAETCQARDDVAGRVAAEIALTEHHMRRQALPQAKLHAEQARLAAETQPGGSTWPVYSLLRQIAEMEGDADGQRHWRRQAQEAFIIAPESQIVRQQWAELIEAAARGCRGQALDVETVELVEKLESQPEWRAMAQAIWRALGGERSEALYEALDPMDATVIQAILARLHTLEAETDADSAE